MHHSILEDLLVSTHRLAALNHGSFNMSRDLSEMLQRQFDFFGKYFLEADVLQMSGDRGLTNSTTVRAGR
jgi:hypothetical protein